MPPRESPGPLHAAVYGGGLGAVPPSMVSVLPGPSHRWCPMQHLLLETSFPKHRTILGLYLCVGLSSPLYQRHFIFLSGKMIEKQQALTQIYTGHLGSSSRTPR